MIDNLIEAIAHERELAEGLKKEADTNRDSWGNIDTSYLERAKEYEQLASWLEELVERREADSWIPVSERLPEDREDTYWVCTDGKYQCQCRWTNVNPFWTNLKTDWHWCHFDIPQYQEVIAWKPLPESYESEDK